MEKQKRQRGRPPPVNTLFIYPGCGRKKKYRDGYVVPCECVSCKEPGR